MFQSDGRIKVCNEKSLNDRGLVGFDYQDNNDKKGINILMCRKNSFTL
jgi:hypothetical protein